MPTLPIAELHNAIARSSNLVSDNLYLGVGMTDAIASDLLKSGAVTGQWALDTTASTVNIAHKTLWGLVKVKGTFSLIAGEGAVSPDGIVTGKLTIDTASIETKNKKRDEHLRSADFLNVDAYPEMTLAVRTGTLAGNVLGLESDLTVLAVKEPIQVIAEVSAATTSRVTLRVATDVQRERFGLTWNKLGMMKGPTTVTVNAVFTRTA